jgi:hypothetical protein
VGAYRKRIAADRERFLVSSCRVRRIASQLLIEIRTEFFLDGLYRGGMKKLVVWEGASASTALLAQAERIGIVCAQASIRLVTRGVG